MSDTPTIQIEGVSHPILCGLCEAPIAFLGEPNAQSGKVGCLSCGNVDEAQEVARSAVDYAKDHGQILLNRLARDAAQNSKIMTFSGQTEHDGAHRFIVKFELRDI